MGSEGSIGPGTRRAPVAVVDDWTRVPGIGMIGPDAAARTVESARLAEEAGLGSVWIAEDYFFPSAFPLLAAAAAVTRRVPLVAGVVNPYTRHPALLAMETATLSVLAPDRVVLGLGASLREWIETRMGIPYTRPLGTLRESVEVIRALLAGRRVEHAGPAFTLRQVALEFPHSGASVPIVIGAKEPRGLALAGAIGDGLHLSVMTTPAYVRRARATAEAARREAGRANSRLPVTANVLVSIDGDRRLAARAAAPVSRALPRHEPQPDDSPRRGACRDTHAAIPDRARAGEAAVEAVTEDLVDRFALAGTPDDCSATLASSPASASRLTAGEESRKLLCQCGKQHGNLHRRGAGLASRHCKTITTVPYGIGNPEQAIAFVEGERRRRPRPGPPDRDRSKRRPRCPGFGRRRRPT